MGGRIAEQVRRALILAAKTAPVVVVALDGCTISATVCGGYGDGSDEMTATGGMGTGVITATGGMGTGVEGGRCEGPFGIRCDASVEAGKDGR